MPNTAAASLAHDQPLTGEGVSIEAYTWQVRLGAKDPRKLYAILFACVIAALVGMFMLHSPIFAVIGFAAIAFSTAEFWMPQRYTIDRNGATARCGMSITAINWDSVKRAIADDNGVKLSPLAEEGRMSPFRGVYLRFADNREEVLERIEAARGSHE